MNRTFTFVLAMAVSLAFTAAVPAADESAGKDDPMAEEQKLMNPRGSVRSSVNVILGSISKIDASDPSKIKVEVTGERDNQLHIIEIAPSTSITKVTDISELKAGDAVRVMARKSDDKEVAMGIMFGNLKRLPAAPKEIPKK